MNQEQIAGVLAGREWCGRQLNERQVEATAAALAPLIQAAQAEAWDEGQKSGARHADRMIAAHSIGRLDLPGPLSPNPYRMDPQP